MPTAMATFIPCSLGLAHPTRFDSIKTGRDSNPYPLSPKLHRCCHYITDLIEWIRGESNP